MKKDWNTMLHGYRKDTIERQITDTPPETVEKVNAHLDRNGSLTKEEVEQILKQIDQINSLPAFYHGGCV